MSKRSLVRSRWAALGAAVAVTVTGGAVLGANAAPSGDSAASSMVTMVPCRFLDTRVAGERSTPLTPGETASFVAHGSHGACNVPAEATAVAATVTAVAPDANGYATVFASASSMPKVSSLNWQAGVNAIANEVTTQLSADGAFSVFNSAGTTNIVIDFVGYFVPASSGVGPKGDKGDVGAAGADGIDGLDGSDGVKGDTGLQGIPGIQGVTGDTGLQGIPGIQGVTGDTGVQGVPGVKGDTGVQGVAGVKGDTGNTGLQGIAGVKGDTGNTGLQGVAGLKGDQGVPGVPAGTRFKTTVDTNVYPNNHFLLAYSIRGGWDLSASCTPANQTVVVSVQPQPATTMTVYSDQLFGGQQSFFQSGTVDVLSGKSYDFGISDSMGGTYDISMLTYFDGGVCTVAGFVTDLSAITDAVLIDS